MGINNQISGNSTTRIHPKKAPRRKGHITPAEREARNLQLCEELKAGNKEAFNELVALNKPMLVQITRKMNAFINEDEAMQEAMLMLHKVALNYDPSYNVAFGTYAYSQISLIIKSICIRSPKASGLRLPQQIAQILIKVKAIRAKSSFENSEEIPNEELCKKLGISLEKLNNALEYLHIFNQAISLDSMVSDYDSEQLLHEKIADPFQASSQLEANNLAIAIRNKLKRAITERVLNEREVKMLTEFYGLETDGDHVSYKSIGTNNGLTRERVRQIINTAILKLQRSGYFNEIYEGQKS